MRDAAPETGNGTSDSGMNRQILWLAVPNVIASLSDPLVGIVDTALVGHLPVVAYMGAVDMVMLVSDRGVQVLGGHGYIREHPVELWYRNARAISALTGLAIV